MNICNYIIKNKLPYTFKNGKIVQKGLLNLINCGITSLDGFVQNGDLRLTGNKITSLKGFKQNGVLNLSFNKITSLEGFTPDGSGLILYGNKVKLDEHL